MLVGHMLVICLFAELVNGLVSAFARWHVCLCTCVRLCALCACACACLHPHAMCYLYYSIFSTVVAQTNLNWRINVWCILIEIFYTQSCKVCHATCLFLFLFLDHQGFFYSLLKWGAVGNLSGCVVRCWWWVILELCYRHILISRLRVMMCIVYEICHVCGISFIVVLFLLIFSLCAYRQQPSASVCGPAITLHAHYETAYVRV